MKNKYDVGIICAMQIEAEILIKQLKKKNTKFISGIKYYSGIISDKRVVVCICGIGKVFASIAAQTMILKYNPNYIINTGVGGSLSTKLKIGDIVISKDFVQHDMDTSAIGDPKSFLSGINLIYIPADEFLINEIKKSIEKVGVNSIIGTIATGDQFISSYEGKIGLNKEYGAIACDMEGGSIAQVCYVSNVKCCAIRAISDELNGRANEDYNKFAARAAQIGAQITINFIENLKESK